MNVVFLHGLNTYGDDDLHVGPFRVGEMNKRWREALIKRGFQCLTLEGLGAVDLETQAERVREILIAQKWWSLPALHLVGHSTGGLLARVLASQNETPIKSVVTFGTPHFGSIGAEFGLNFAAKAPLTSSVLTRLGYDPRAKTEIFGRFTRAAMRVFNERYSERPGIRYAYGLCETEFRKLSWPLQPLYPLLHPHKADRGHSDGFVLAESQKWGEKLGSYELDHFGNLGFFFQIIPKHKKEAEREFARLADDVKSWILRADSF